MYSLLISNINKKLRIGGRGDIYKCFSSCVRLILNINPGKLAKIRKFSRNMYAENGNACSAEVPLQAPAGRMGWADHSGVPGSYVRA